MPRGSTHRWIGATLALLGVVGVAIAVTAVLTALPAPAAGGTCGPGRGSESAIVAFFDPGSIGAGAEPPAANTTSHAQWLAFVAECQSATDARVLAGLAVLVLSLLLVLGGLLIIRRGSKRAPIAAGPVEAYPRTPEPAAVAGPAAAAWGAGKTEPSPWPAAWGPGAPSVPPGTGAGEEPVSRPTDPPEGPPNPSEEPPG
jgi:hypothetical protein